MVQVSGEKMSKSLGNYVSLPDLLSRYDPRAYRLLVLQSHYRSPMTVTEATMTAAARTLERLDGLARRFAGQLDGVIADEAAVERFRARMDDDLNTTAAIADAFDLVTRANALADEGRLEEARPIAAAVLDVATAVGLVVEAQVVGPDEEAAALATQRDEARAAKDWGQADALRAQLQDLGWIVEDGPSGTQIRRR
jgi:cysteinyl-tRNA synthetase